jgi:general secretion pathway protein D
MLTLVLPCILSVGLLAQPAPKPAANQVTPEANTLVSLPSQLDLARLVDLCSERLKYTIDYDAAALKVPVTIRAPQQLTNQELWNLTNRLLASKGFTTVRQGVKQYSVVKLADAAASSTLVQIGEADPAGFQLVAIRPKGKTLKEAADLIRPLLSKPGGTLTEVSSQGVLLLSDLSSRIEQCRAMLSMMDSPELAGSDVVVEELPVRSGLSSAVAPLVMQLAQKSDALRGKRTPGEVIAGSTDGSLLIISPREDVLRWKELVAQLDGGKEETTVTYVPRVFAVQDVAKLIEEVTRSNGVATGKLKVVPDVLTGSLVITGSAAQHRVIEDLLKRLDATDTGSAPLRAFPIKNRPVAEIVGTLTQLLQAGAGDATPANSREQVIDAGQQRTIRDPSSTIASQGSATQASGSSVNRDATAGSDRARSSQSASETQGLTRGPGRVTLTADESTNTLIAIGEPRLLSQIESLLALLDVRQPQVMLEVMMISLTDSDALNLGIELERLGSLDGSAVKLSSLFGLSSGTAGNRTPIDGTGFTGSVINPGDFSVVIKALQSLNNGRTSSMPRLLVRNNERASFSSVLQQPVATTVNSNTATTTSYGGTEDAGTTVSVQPQISQGDHLSLVYDIRLSSFVGAASGPGLPPPKQQNTISSVASLPDGHVVVIGGIELISDSKGVSQVPLVGDIPVLGEAFKSRTRSAARTRFYTFIRATVLRNAGFEDLKHFSAQQAEPLGIADGFPQSEPRIIK